MPNCIYKQICWYLICQLVTSKRAANNIASLHNLLQIWNSFRADYHNIAYENTITNETSQCIAEACVQLSISYTNNIGKYFEARSIKYLIYIIQNGFKISF